MLAQSSYIREIHLQLPPAYWSWQYTPKQIFPCPDGGVIILGDLLAHWGEEHIDPLTAGDCGAIKLNAQGDCEWQWLSRNFSGWGEPHIIGIDQDAGLAKVGDRVNEQPNAYNAHNRYFLGGDE
jgi:hypothetical protein